MVYHNSFPVLFTLESCSVRPVMVEWIFYQFSMHVCLFVVVVVFSPTLCFFGIKLMFIFFDIEI